MSYNGSKEQDIQILVALQNTFIVCCKVCVCVFMCVLVGRKQLAQLRELVFPV